MVPIRGSASHAFGLPGSLESENGNEVLRTDVPHAIDPVISLFDNPIVSSAPASEGDLLIGQWRNDSNLGAGNPLTPPTSSEFVSSSDGSCPTKAARTCAALLKDIPPSDILAIILNVTSSWWNTWYASVLLRHSRLLLNFVDISQEVRRELVARDLGPKQRYQPAGFHSLESLFKRSVDDCHRYFSHCNLVAATGHQSSSAYLGPAATPSWGIIPNVL